MEKAAINCEIIKQVHIEIRECSLFIKLLGVRGERQANMNLVYHIFL